MKAEMEKAGKVAIVDGAASRVYWGFVVSYIVLSAAHLIVVTHDSTGRYIGSYIVICLVQWLTIAALIWRWRRSSFPNTLRWGLAIIAMFFIHLVNIIALKRTIYEQHNPTPGALLICSAVYAVLVILSCSTTFRSGMVRVANFIDGAMAIALTALFFVQIFSIVSLNGSDNLNDTLFIVRMYDVLGVFMTLCAGVRLLGAERAPRRHFFFVLAVYLLTSTLFGAVRNRLLLAYGSEYLELMLLPQYLVFGLLCLRPLPRWLVAFHPRPSMVYVAESLSPLFLGLGLLGVSISIWNGHPVLGAAGVSVTVIGYGIRNVITQSEQMATEHSLRVLQSELENLVVTDPLTGIANRRGFDAALERLWNRVQSSDMQLSILMIDIDHFKRFNDNFGHALGDTCLTAVATCLDKILTPLGCFVARYGGEEFAVLLPATTLEQAIEIGETLRRSVTDIRLPNADEPLRVTVSIGLANYEESKASNGKALLVIADEALFDAKSRGRNQVAWPRTSELKML